MNLWTDWSGPLANFSHEALLLALLVAQLAGLLSIPSVLLRRRGRPTSALAWLLALITLPAMGAVAWWAFGRTRIERRLRRHLLTKQDFVSQQGSPVSRSESQFDTLLPTRAQNEYVFASRGNCVELLSEGGKAFAALSSAIATAQSCVHLQFYIFRLDETGSRLVELLVERAQAGVQVRVLVDALGSRSSAASLRRRLQPHGIEVGIFRPSRYSPLHAPRFNFVNHRKIVVIDNHIAFTGGMNVGVEYETSWRDLMLRIQGPAVAGLHHIFLEDWYFATGTVIDDPLRDQHVFQAQNCDAAILSSGPDTEAWILDAYFLAITQAKSQVFLATPYFIPPQALLAALRTAAGRGVDVRLIVPSHSDVKFVKWASRSFYGQLVDVGVRIFEYEGTMLHAKALLVDDARCSVGSANLDNRSLHLNFEVTCLMENQALATDLRTWFDNTLDGSCEVTPALIANKGTPRKLIESAAHLLSPLL